jgi:hypothetical protein
MDADPIIQVFDLLTKAPVIQLRLNKAGFLSTPKLPNPTYFNLNEVGFYMLPPLSSKTAL